jgi:hypothetical protein
MKKALIPVLILVCSLLASPAFALFESKFEVEASKEIEAVKLHRDALAGGYDLVTGAELKKMMDEGKDMVLIDTMPYEASYKKEHVPGAGQFLFPIPDMNEWDATETDGKSQARTRTSPSWSTAAS